MNTKQLNEFVTFIPGINPTRAQKQVRKQSKVKTIEYYDQSSFTEDYKHEGIHTEEQYAVNKVNQALKAGDIVISNSLQCATLVSEKNAGKVLSLNFTKVELNEQLLNKEYFLFLFNAYKNVKYQKEKKLQGSGPILKIPLQSLGEIMIPIVPMEEQRKMGAIYVKTLKLQSELSEYGKLMELFANELLEESIMGC
ncbi:MAG: restriction endonuclease subunit S [Clostridia bacterium]|nr:restriction endonuclease subunit S [Anaerostipes sp.]NCC02254.1 restriction endonuclease subunit S [Clostridia bacterium]